MTTVQILLALAVGLAVTSMMTARSGPAIRAALLAHAPSEECAQCEAEFRSALTRAAADLDLSAPQAVLARWHALATMAANPPTDDEREQIERAKTRRASAAGPNAWSVLKGGHASVAPMLGI